MSGALAGIVGALLFGTFTSFLILARAGDDILVIRAGKLGGDARAVLASARAPFRPAPTTDRHQMRLEIELAGHRLFVSSFVRERYDDIVGTGAA